MEPIKGIEVHATCGVAKLLAATLGGTLTEMFPRVGLELCPHCGSASNNPPTYPFCSPKHYAAYYRAARAVPLICDECGIFFVRKESEVMQWAKRGGQGIFCVRSCHSKNNGRKHGFGTEGNTALEVRWADNSTTHCKRGHERTPENTYIYPSGKNCRACTLLGTRGRKKFDATPVDTQQLKP